MVKTIQGFEHADRVSSISQKSMDNQASLSLEMDIARIPGTHVGMCHSVKRVEEEVTRSLVDDRILPRLKVAGLAATFKIDAALAACTGHVESIVCSKLGVTASGRDSQPSPPENSPSRGTTISGRDIRKVALKGGMARPGIVGVPK